MIRIENLVHHYGRDGTALDGINLTVDRGECFGLIGANGAGKTTTLRILATLLTPTSGTASIDGHDVLAGSLEIRRLIGYMADSAALFPEFSVGEFLDYVAACYGLRAEAKKRRVADVVELTNLGSKIDAGCDTLSLGIKQRVSLARALIFDPEVLLLDEPTSGLDPAARIEFRHIMNELTAAGKTSIVSSHILPELSEFCTSVGIIEKGKVVTSGKVSELLRDLAGPRQINIEVKGDARSVANALRGRAGIDKVRTDGSTAVVQYSGSRESLADLLVDLIQAEVPVVGFAARDSSLEEIFLKVAAFEIG